MAINETALVGRIYKAIMREHPTAWVIKIVGHPHQESGLPDLLAVVEGRAVGLEVKNVRPGETHEHAVSRATPGQLVQITRIRRAGAVAEVVTSSEEALAAIRAALEKES
jgi:hypothetical protein